MSGCIRDASPDAWGRRVLANKRLGRNRDEGGHADLDELAYLLESGSDRIGALDFQTSPATYAPRLAGNAPLHDLLEAAALVEQGKPLQSDLNMALQHGSSLGGARPKVLLEAEERKYIAKFPAAADIRNVVKAEFVAMRLAAEAGLDVAPVRLTSALGKDVLLVERFDRVKSETGWQRKPLVSALTLLSLDEMMARYASYEMLAEIVRHRFIAPMKALRELFSRIVFNIVCGNTDDHARNHSAFWNGDRPSLTPAYDICPQIRTGREASQAMTIHGSENASRFAVCLEAAPAFMLDAESAKTLIIRQISAVQERWPAVCDEAALSDAERLQMWRRQFLNPFAFDNAPAEIRALEPRH